MKPSDDVDFVNWRVALFCVGGLVCVLLILGSAVPRMPVSAPPPTPASDTGAPVVRPAYADDFEQAAKRVDVLARQTKGDFSKLSEQDQRWLDAETAGHAREFLRKRARFLETKDKKSRDQGLGARD